MAKNYNYCTINDPDAKITVTTSYYTRTDSGRWKTKPYKTATTSCSVDEYNNFVESIPFFRDRVKCGYTTYGYVPIRLTAISWGGDTKVVREFEID